MHVCVCVPSLFHGNDLGVDVFLLAPHVLHVSQDLGHVVRADLQVLLLQTGHLGDHRARLAGSVHTYTQADTHTHTHAHTHTEKSMDPEGAVWSCLSKILAWPDYTFRLPDPQRFNPQMVDHAGFRLAIPT